MPRQTMDASVKRPRISIDVQPELRKRVRLAAALRELTVQDYVRSAIEAQLQEDLEDAALHALAVLTAETDPVFAELWDNPADAVYDRI